MKNAGESTTARVIKPISIRLTPSQLSSSQDALVVQLADEMVSAWHNQQRRPVEYYLDRHPHLKHLPPAVLDLIYEEICLRRERGESLQLSEFAKRFPTLKQQIAVLLNCVDALEVRPPHSFPSVGQSIGGFRLIAELGRGGQGRVFLATESALGDRPVVLKITPRSGHEHLSLARLQHTYIVPLLSVADDLGSNSRVLCMPYFGGMTLAAILADLADRPPAQRTGQHIIDVLEQARARSAIAVPRSQAPAWSFLQRASYVQAIAWLGACFAEALEYAHDRNLAHLDVKPSNVLLTADCQPMLLDFHLASSPMAPGDPGARFGGTPLYMSPEQKRTMSALREGKTVAETIDGRSDIYSLALILYEALGGHLPPEGMPVSVPLHLCNPQVSVGLSDLLAKCLAANPRDRYPGAGAVAADLWRHLHNQPLQGVANRSIHERWRKWRNRKPHSLALLGMLGVVGLVVLFSLSFAYHQFGQRVEEAQIAYQEGQTFLTNSQHAEAIRALERGLALVQGLPWQSDLRRQYQRQLDFAHRAQIGDELHKIANQARLLYGLDLQSPQRFQKLESQCRAIWEKRRVIADQLNPGFEDERTNRVRRDLLDLAILGTSLRVRLGGPKEADMARREALQVLAEAESLFGPNAVLFHERSRHLTALGQADSAETAKFHAESLGPQTAWEFYALGRSWLESDQLESALAYLDQAVALEPSGLWPLFYQGVCCHRLGRFDDAALAFTACIYLAPETAGCFYNRALAFAGLKRNDRAVRDLEEVLKLDPQHAEAFQLIRALRK